MSSIINYFSSIAYHIASFAVGKFGFVGGVLLVALLPIYLFLAYRYFVNKHAYHFWPLLLALLLSVVMITFMFGIVVVSNSGI